MMEIQVHRYIITTTSSLIRSSAVGFNTCSKNEMHIIYLAMIVDTSFLTVFPLSLEFHLYSFNVISSINSLLTCLNVVWMNVFLKFFTELCKKIQTAVQFKNTTVDYCATCVRGCVSKTVQI